MLQDTFSDCLIAWQKQHGRHHLPWQVRDPYCIWVSEIMLQQTQVATVLDYYPRFITAFPTVQDLAHADQNEVLRLWAGLGYYSRARHLHTAAKQIVDDFGGKFPQTRLQLEQLKGVGRSTAAAIAAFAFNQRESILDGNVKRVLCRMFAQDGDLNSKAFESQLWVLAQSLLPKHYHDMPAYTQGLMDFGATICVRSQPQCHLCPMQSRCQAYAQNRTHELPRKKTKAILQKQTLYWLIIQRTDGAIYLNKRPNNGIWANLFCVPTYTQENDIQPMLEKYNSQTLPSITHKLTHRLLTIYPYHFTVPYHYHDQANPDGVWVLPTQLSHYGLPKPLSTLIHKMCA